ncbi:MAG: hypothetical protein PHU06_05340 [Gallionella sp.]|nr:hypothetical protein [Gallionella sp.]MDD4960534.1 hypothetical protein [Gallionella sp.]
MKKIDIDFYRSANRKSLLGLVVLLCGILSGIFVLSMRHDLSEKIAEIESTGIKKHKLNGNQRAEDGSVLQDAANQLSLPWGSLFALIEELSTDDILIQNLEGDGHSRTIKIVAQAPHAEAMLDYLERLKSSDKFSVNWRLLSHHKDENGALNFVIQSEFPEKNE